MTEFKKIDKVLQFVINCEEPPRRSATEIANEIELQITTKETIEILDKLTKDGFVIKEIHADNIAYYFSSFEGRLFFLNGGYISQNKSNQRKDNKDKFITNMTVTNIFIIIILTFLNYRATDKANDNKEQVFKLNNSIQDLTNSNDSLRNIILSDTTKKKH